MARCAFNVCATLFACLFLMSCALTVHPTGKLDTDTVYVMFAGTRTGAETQTVVLLPEDQPYTLDDQHRQQFLVVRSSELIRELAEDVNWSLGGPIEERRLVAEFHELLRLSQSASTVQVYVVFAGRLGPDGLLRASRWIMPGRLGSDADSELIRLVNAVPPSTVVEKAD
jgi:hypothetical protein